ncbi:hypothetical protein HGH93_28570 [Chitinophaga polysaccharea]|uniref:immunoglobulin domain-containing protein n=1 Tax=Chitinophaga polysaccharea TaxID=1293035 RepID=UPI001455301E|nr:hypothetical protein [Chitinophaga polysaccharea]NLR62080.1 hypothetical protein [Chitinophaga polysaccharea]
MRIPFYVLLNIEIAAKQSRSTRGLRYVTILCFFSLIFPFSSVSAQSGCPVPKIRKYALGQRPVATPLLASVTNAGNAADGNPVTNSTLNAALGVLGLVTATQYLSFNSQVAAGTPVYVKINYPVSLVGLGSSFTVQPFVYDASHNEQPVGLSYTAGDLLAVLSGAGDMEVAFTPQTAAGTPVAYDGVSVTLNGVLSVGASMGVYDAYILQDATSATCNQPIDVLAGVRAGGLSIANATGSVITKWNAIDADPTLSTYAQLNTGLAVLSEVFETVLFNTTTRPGDSIYIVLQDPGAGLLDLNLLTGFTIQPYLGKTAAGSPITNTNTLLNLRLLTGAGNKYVLSAAIPAAFDRIDIQMGGVVGALSSLLIYDVKTIMPVPTYGLTINGSASANPVCIKDAGKLQLNISNADPCATYNWYQSNNTTLLGTGTSFKPVITSPGTYTYYVEAVRSGCNSIASNRMPVTVTVVPRPGAPLLTIQLNP